MGTAALPLAAVEAGRDSLARQSTPKSWDHQISLRTRGPNRAILRVLLNHDWTTLRAIAESLVIMQAFLCSTQKTFWSERSFWVSAIPPNRETASDGPPHFTGRREFRRTGRSSGVPLLASVIFSALLFGTAVIGAPAQPPGQTGEPSAWRESAAVPAADLDRAIDQVLSRPEFSWRMPRVQAAEQDQPGWLRGFVQSTFEMLGDWTKAIMRFGRKIFQWIQEKLFNKLQVPLAGGGSGTGWMTSLQLLLYGLTALVVALLAIMALRLWRRRRFRTDEILATPMPAEPDLSDESVLADELPKEGWLRLGHELMGRGELRLALRAFYLAALAHLGHRELVRIARSKSNREYEYELRRRAHSRPELVAAFAESVRLFDRVWYGRHKITIADLNGFQDTVERIAAC
ncbi:MAG: DUF4129 domain-containing protein [Verrucomicrobiales bacterium]|nr:DUF4129 domain-containing protein [Verrucomicrobiales bacterium]